LRYFCSPQHTDSAFYPIIGQMERAAGYVHDDTPQVKLSKLDAVLAQTSTRSEDVTLFAEMLSLPTAGRYPTLDLTPAQRRQRTLEALVSQMESLARQSPVLMIFEDAHWSDPTSLESFGRVVDGITNLSVLLLITFRPEFAPAWIGQPHVTALTLSRLPKREIDALIDGVVGNKLLPVSIRQDIIERTDGIPLFVEEMTKAVLEAESEVETRRTAAAIPAPALAVPASLQASLMARLDRLGPAKEIAQIGAAIGREFSHSLLDAVAREPEGELQSALDRLIQAGLLFRRGEPPNASYLFKHALVQDAAYGTLLRKPRRALHARIAETIERRFSEIAESHPELLARHCTEAGQIEKAASLWGKAGQRSLERSALVEAVEQLTRALDQIAALPSTPALRQQQIKFQLPVATALGVMKGYAAPVTQAALEQAQAFIERAEVLGEPPEDPLLLFSLLTGFWAASFNVFNGDLLCKIAGKYLALAEKQGASIPLISEHNLMGRSLVYTSKFAQGRAHLDRAIAMYDAAQHLPVKRFTTDPRVICLAVRSITFWMLGYPAAALTDADEALTGAREIGQAYTLMQVLINVAAVHLWCGNYQKAQALYDELVVFAEDKGAWYHKVFGVLGQGGVGAFAGNSADAVRMLTEGIAAVRSAGGANVALPINLSFLAIALAGTGNFEGAWRCIGEAIPMIEETGERWFEPEVHRSAGDVALKSQEHDALKAEKYFERALTVARQQQAKSWELRAAMSMARLWRDQGKPDEARELLAPVYGWFTEGFDTLDLKEAKALLDELAT
jgi:predicted ATPase